jgi:biopolymer transport protein ExbD
MSNQIPYFPSSSGPARQSPSVIVGTSFKVAVSILLLLGPPAYLAWNARAYTPLVDTMFSVLLFLMAFWLGRDVDHAKAREEASRKWLPQAEAVTYRLLTLYGNVRSFAGKTKRSCTESACDLPELKEESLKSVRIKFKADCNAASDRLEDIANQLEDAIGDWQRFIAENCRGEECGRIFAALQERRGRIMQQDHDSAPAQLKPVTT